MVGAVDDGLGEAAGAAPAEGGQRHQRDPTGPILAAGGAGHADLVVRARPDHPRTVGPVAAVSLQGQAAGVVREVVAEAVVHIAVVVVVDAVAAHFARVRPLVAQAASIRDSSGGTHQQEARSRWRGVVGGGPQSWERGWAGRGVGWVG